MPGSTSLGFPYPLSSEAPDVPSDVEALADAVDTYLTGLDSGWQACTLLSGTTGSLSARRIGDVVYLRGSLVRSDFANGSWVSAATLPSSDFQPAAYVQVAAAGPVNSSDRSQATIRVQASDTDVAVGMTGTATEFGTVYANFAYLAT